METGRRSLGKGKYVLEVSLRVYIAAILALAFALLIAPWSAVTALFFRHHRHNPNKVVRVILWFLVTLNAALAFVSSYFITGMLGYSDELGRSMLFKLFDIASMLMIVFQTLLLTYLIIPRYKRLTLLAVGIWICVSAFELITGLETRIIVIDSIQFVHVLRPLALSVWLFIYYVLPFGTYGMALFLFSQRLNEGILRNRIRMLSFGYFFSAVVGFEISIGFHLPLIPMVISGALAIASALIFVTLLYCSIFRGEELLRLFSFEGALRLDPMSKDSRLCALLATYTSRKGECEFYDTALRSKCRLEPSSYHLHDCEGRCFVDGVVCTLIYRRSKDLESKSDRTR
ncbi:MAG: hypothetical protein ACFFBS_07600 [Promethearchaeota archaeon]